MRTPRVLGFPEAPVNFYHCMSRMLQELPFWRDQDKAQLDQIFHSLLAFSGLKEVSYCWMGNHFHLLLGVSNEKVQGTWEMSDADLMVRLGYIYTEREVQQIAKQLRGYRENQKLAQAEALRGRYFRRMDNLSVFMKEVKQRFTCWYNRTYKRRGTIWCERFKSVVVEGSENALRTIAAYIDLNPIRAGLVEDPKDYFWCGYAKAVGGCLLARAGLTALVQGEVGADETSREWPQIQAIYRTWLYAEGAERTDERGRVTKAGFDPEEVEAVMKSEGRLAYPVLAKQRIRHLSSGGAIGSKDWLERVFEANLSSFGPNRVDGARKIGVVKWGGLQSLRDLKG